MRRKNEKTAEIIENYINSFFRMFRRSPSLREIEGEIGISRQTIHRYLKSMSEEGILHYDGKNIITRYIDKLTSTQVLHLAIRGRIVCGDSVSEEEYVEGYIDFPSEGLGDGTFFALRAYGDSMKNAGIDEGDLVIVRSQTTADIGQIVVAVDSENRNTLKRLSHDGCRFYLHPENPEYSDIYPSEIRIQGLALKVIKDII